MVSKEASSAASIVGILKGILRADLRGGGRGREGTGTRAWTRVQSSRIIMTCGRESSRLSSGVGIGRIRAYKKARRKDRSSRLMRRRKRKKGRDTAELRGGGQEEGPTKDGIYSVLNVQAPYQRFSETGRAAGGLWEPRDGRESKSPLTHRGLHQLSARVLIARPPPSR